MAFGIQTWDANGKQNNYGLVPISVLGFFGVSTGQQGGAVSYTVPAGFIMDFLQVVASDVYTTTRRRITVSGATISLAAVADTDFSAGTFPAVNGFIVVYLRAA